MSSIKRMAPSGNGLSITIKEVFQNKTFLKLEFHVRATTSSNEDNEYYTRPSFIINNAVAFQMSMSNVPEYSNYRFHVKFSQLSAHKSYVVKYEHMYDTLTTIKNYFHTDDAWYLIQTYEPGVVNCEFTITLELCEPSSITTMDIKQEKRNVTKFASMHDDTELIDFELRGKDGSVHLHKAIAAATSPVLRTMFSGEWRETSEGVVDVLDYNKVTLQHLKDYIYLDTLPEMGLEELLLLALYYMIPDLELRCIEELMKSLTKENAHDLIEFSVTHNVKQLLNRILKQLQNGSLILDI